MFGLSPREDGGYNAGVQRRTAMTIGEHITEFEGKKIQEWHVGDHVDPTMALRVSVEYDDPQTGAALITALAAAPGADKIEAIVVGQWDGEQFEAGNTELVQAFVDAANKFKSLKAVFLGEIVYEECEISWLHQGDVAPLLKAYPALEVLYIRGGEDLAFGKINHAHLQKLVVQTGGLGGDTVTEIAEAHLPALTHLELWLGTDSYGGNTTVDQLAPLLSGRAFPKLKYLGLRDSEIADAIATAAANAPALSTLEELDLSMGTLGDLGGNALLASPLVKKLKRLNLAHHYLSADVIDGLSKLSGVKVDLSDGQGADDPDDRYVSVSE
jgi:hypothetical protein